jgi:hypothetical protein
VTGRSASVTVGRPPLRDRWRRVIFATRRVSPAVALTMLTYAEHMRADGYVSVKQTTIMARRNMSARTVKDHVAAAIAAGVLDRVSHGYDGHTAQYRAVLPSPREGEQNKHPLGVENAHPLPAREGEHVPHPSTYSEPVTPVTPAARRTSAGAQ